MQSSLSKLSILALALLALAAGTAWAASVPLHSAPAEPAGEVLMPRLATPGAEARSALDELLYDYDVVDLPLARLENRVQAGDLSLILRNQLFELTLEPNDLRAEGYRAVLMTDAGPVEVEPGPVVTFKGTVREEPDSLVRLTASDELFSGYIKTADDWVFVDPLRAFVPGASVRKAVVYRERDVRPEAAGECGVGHRLRAVGQSVPGTGTGFDAGSTLGSRAHTTLRRLQVATEHDGQYYQRYGNPGVFNRSQGILNDVDGIYRSQINLYISISYQQTWTSVSGDPYTSLDAGTTLNQFRSWWESNRSGTTRDTAHMFSGKDFNGGTIGIAWVGVICNRRDLSYGISQDLSSSFQRAQLTAHEIGHNLSAQHDDQIGCSGVSCNGYGPIMCSFIQSNGSNVFSSCSRSSIDSHTHNNGSCLN
jgi:hypothetical protein